MYGKGSIGKRYRGDDMDDYLSTLNLVRKVNAKDDSSIFRAVAEQVYLTQERHGELRHCVMEYLDKKKDEKDDANYGINRAYKILSAVSVLLRRDIVIYREVKKSPENVLGCRKYPADKIVLVESFGGYVDSVNPLSWHENLAIAQSIIYEILYHGVFGVPMSEVRAAVTLIRNRQEDHGYRNPFSRRSRFHSAAAGSIGSDAGGGSSAELEFSPMGASLVGMATNVLQNQQQNNQRQFAQPHHNGYNFVGLSSPSVAAMIRPPFPFRVAKALDPAIYRNIEYDRWVEWKKNMLEARSIELSMSGQFSPNTSCLAMDGHKYALAVVQEIIDDETRSVFFPDTGRMQKVKTSDMRPLDRDYLMRGSGGGGTRTTERRMTEGSMDDARGLFNKKRYRRDSYRKDGSNRPPMGATINNLPQQPHHHTPTTTLLPVNFLPPQKRDRFTSDPLYQYPIQTPICFDQSFCPSDCAMHPYIDGFEGMMGRTFTEPFVCPEMGQSIVYPPVFVDPNQQQNQQFLTPYQNPYQNVNPPSPSQTTVLYPSLSVMPQAVGGFVTAGDQQTVQPLPAPQQAALFESQQLAPQSQLQPQQLAPQSQLQPPQQQQQFDLIPSHLVLPFNVPTITVPHFDMYTLGFVNLDAKPSALFSGADLPFHDVTTLRFFYNLGVEYGQMACLRGSVNGGAAQPYHQEQQQHEQPYHQSVQQNSHQYPYQTLEQQSQQIQQQINFQQSQPQQQSCSASGAGPMPPTPSSIQISPDRPPSQHLSSSPSNCSPPGLANISTSSAAIINNTSGANPAVSSVTGVNQHMTDVNQQMTGVNQQMTGVNQQMTDVNQHLVTQQHQSYQPSIYHQQNHQQFMLQQSSSAVNWLPSSSM